MNKRGTLTQTTIISLVIVILAGAILFLVLKNIIDRNQLDKEACKQTVDLRNNAILGGTGATPALVPLKCKTENIEVKTSDEGTIKRTIAGSLYDCWWMLGEGKADFFSPVSWWQVTNPFLVEQASCIVCSTIKFDDRVKSKNIEINLAEYLEETKIPQKNITYLDYFTDAPNSKFEGIGDSDTMTINEDYAVIYMSMKGAKIGETLIKSGATGAVTGVITGASAGAIVGGVGAIPGAIIGGLVGIIGGVAHGGLSVSANQKASIVHCETNSGCNVLMLVPFTGEGMNVCQNIESIP